MYNTKRWRILRKRVLFEEPVCRACLSALSTDVDHIVPMPEGKPYDRANLQGLCAPCHSRKTRAEQ